MCLVQLAKRYYNAHALVDLCVSAVLDHPENSNLSAGTKKVVDLCIVVSTPTVIEKGVHLSGCRATCQVVCTCDAARDPTGLVNFAMQELSSSYTCFSEVVHGLAGNMMRDVACAFRGGRAAVRPRQGGVEVCSGSWG